MIRKIKPRYDDDTVLSILRRRKIYISADCGGRGTCGRCRVRITDPASCDVPSDAERALLSENEIAGGIRLACMARVTGPAEVEILPDSLIPEESGHGDIAARKIEPLLQS